MMTVFGDRVLVALPPREDEIVSAGGIVLVKDHDRFYTPTRGTVVALGEKTGTVDLDDVVMALVDCGCDSDASCKQDGYQRLLIDAVRALYPARFDVECGDMVIFPRSAGEQIHDDGIEYVILRESEIIGVVEPKESAA